MTMLTQYAEEGNVRLLSDNDSPLECTVVQLCLDDDNTVIEITGGDIMGFTRVLTEHGLESAAACARVIAREGGREVRFVA